VTAQDADFEDERDFEEMVARALEEDDFEDERALEEEADMEERNFDFDVISFNCSPNNKYIRVETLNEMLGFHRLVCTKRWN
jgi:hypothetical protein